ncbi:zona pellucida sperm-binding protein 1 [Hemicordylus capensis]|uniref:zona pellucida sperm-binding protein 1 n=1 Tax=Hemicordylus capensis TaxID=884348 RepID=UPI002302D032|nr:zona pellucida sperm-binding protein 1 [Hemicordylus capensis]
MGWSCKVFVSLVSLVLLLGFSDGQSDFWRVGSLALQHHCGEYGMQLLVFPSQGHDVRFKVIDEFGTPFEATNCSICRHWITSNDDGAVIFSAGYNGCHVIKKDGRNNLKVRVEELSRNRRVTTTRDINMICPKPQEQVVTQVDNMRLVPQPQPQPGLVRPVPQPQPGLVRPVPQPQPGLVRPVPQPQPQPGLVRPVPQPQPQPGLVRPVPQPQPQPGLVRPVPQPQPQPGLVRPVPQPQPQPGLVRPVPQPQPQPGLVRPVPQPQPQPGLVRPVPQPQPQPGLVRPVPQPQPQPGLVRPVPQPQPQPGLVRPVPQPQPQPGLVRPVPQPQPQPGLVRPVPQPQPQPGLVRPVPQPQPQPGLVRPVPQPQPQPGLVRPVPQPQPQPGLVRPVPQPQPQPGLVRPVPQPQPQPGLVRPVPQPQPQPGLVRPVPQPQPQPGLVRPVPQPQPQPGLVRPVPQPQPQPQPQPGLVRPVPQPQPQPQPQPGLVRPVPQPQPQPQPQPGLVRPVPQPQPQPQPQPGLVRPVPQPQPQPGLVRPVPQPQPQPGLVRPVPQPQPQPGLVRPVPQPQPQPGLVRPVPQPQPQPGLVRPVPQPQPQPGLVRPVPQPQPQPQPGLVRPVPQPQPQPQPGLVRPVPQPQPQPQPGLVRPVPQPQPQPQPGLVRPVPQPQPQPQPGLVRPVPQPQPQPQPGLVRPVPQPQPQPYYIGSTLTLEQCQVLSGRIPCAAAQGPAACYQAGCCYDNRDQAAPCYYGNTVTLQCLQDGHFILVVSRDMTDYPLVLENVRLSYAQAGCQPVRRTEAFLVFRFPLTQCGTTVQVTGGRLIYENELASGIDVLDGPDGSVTRDSTFILHARCVYNATDFLPVQAEVLLPPTPAPVLQAGPLRLELRIARDAAYLSYYVETDYPVVKVLRDPVYVEVRILQRTDPSLMLVLQDCWATPSANPLERLQWPVLVEGCPFEGDNYRTQLVLVGPATSELAFPTHYQRFTLSTFAFVDSASQLVLDGLVYLFCSVSVCHASQLESCRVTCQMPVAANEFGTTFEVTNCSICRHWITSDEKGAVVFSAGYHGCHVLKKDGRNNLKVRIEEVMRNGQVANTYDINMICPKPQDQIMTEMDNMQSVPVPQPQPGLVRPVPQPQPGLVRPVPQPQPGLVRPVPQPQPQPGLVRPVPQPQPQPGLVRPQPQPGLVRPVPQPQPGLVRPVPQPQPGLVRPVPHLYYIGSALTLEQCQVLSGRIPCAAAQGPAACYQAGCCYDNRDQAAPCYYGNTVTLQCLQDGHFILVVSRDMTDYPLVLENVRLSYAQAGCQPVRRTEAFLVFRFPLTQCGTTVQVTGGRLIYENELASGIDVLDGPDGSVTRDSTFILHARCVYNATDFLPVQAEVLLPPTPAPVLQAGPLRLELRIARDAAYLSYYVETDYPVVKVLRDPVYVEVRMLQRTDPSLMLVLQDCWATPSANPLERLQWPVLVEGCPFEGDNYRTQLVLVGPATSELAFPTHYQRFTLSTFAFVDSASQMVLGHWVYLFCSASACHPSHFESCRKTCSINVSSRGRRFLNTKNKTEPLDLVSSLGAVTFAEETGQQAYTSSKDRMDLNIVLFGVISLMSVALVIMALIIIWNRNREGSCSVGHKSCTATK